MRRLPWRWIGIALAVVAIAWFVWGVYRAGVGTPDLPQVTKPVDLKGGHVQGNRISTKSWTFDYSHAQLSPDGTTGTIDGVRNGVIFKDGKPYAHISAEHLTLNLTTLDFTAIGKVHIERVNDSGSRSFDTDYVVWTNNAKSVRMEHPSFVHTNGETLKISTITIDVNTDTVHMGDVQGGVSL